MLLGMDTLVAQAFGAKDLRDCRRTLVNGVWLALGSRRCSRRCCGD